MTSGVWACMVSVFGRCERDVAMAVILSVVAGGVHRKEMPLRTYRSVAKKKKRDFDDVLSWFVLLVAGPAWLGLALDLVAGITLIEESLDISTAG